MARALKTAEGAGKNCQLVGSSGERGCYQYMPGRFAQVSLAVTGKVLEWNELNEEYVTLKYITSRLHAGLSPKEFALEWNQGSAKTACKKGSYERNGKVIQFNSCAHNEAFLIAYNNQ